MTKGIKGLCEKGRDGNRRHHDVMKVDQYGNKFVVCEDCGTCIVETVNAGKVFIEE